MKQEAERSEAWSFRFPIDDEKHIPIEDKFAKLILITKQQGIKKENAVFGNSLTEFTKFNGVANSSRQHTL